MKSNLALLLKLEFTKFLSSFTSKGKKLRKTPIFYVVLLLGFLFFLTSFGYSFLIISPFVSQQIDPSPAIHMFSGIASLLIFMTSLSQARTIYIGDDHDFLASLPIRKRDIVASKIIAMYVIEFVFSFIIMVPHGIVMIIMAHNMSLFFISLLLAFTLPIVPIALAIILSLLITMATARFKYANLVFVILYALVIVGVSLMSVLVNNLRDQDATNMFTTVGGVLKWINPSYYLVELAINSNLLYLILYVAVNVLVAILSVLFIAVFFDRLHDIVSSISMKEKYVRKDLKNKGEAKALLSLEFKRLVNSKVYFINTIMGSIMAIFGSVVYMFSLSRAMTPETGEEAIAIMKLVFIPIYIGIVCMIIGISNPTTGSINIEGKTFWLTKSLPTDYKKYMLIKLLFAWILTIPACLIASTIAVIFIHESVWDIVFGYLIPVAFTLLSSLVGLIVAIHHPKLKWNNEAEAVKNSLSVVIAMLINFGITTVITPLLIVIPLVVKDYGFIAYIATFVGLLIAMIPCGLYLKKNFASRIEAIEDL